MSTQVIPRTDQQYFKSWEIIATANEDSSVAIETGFGAEPFEVVVVPFGQHAAKQAWYVNQTPVDADSFEMAKSTASGTGQSGAHVRVIAFCPSKIQFAS